MQNIVRSRRRAPHILEVAVHVKDKKNFGKFRANCLPGMFAPKAMKKGEFDKLKAELNTLSASKPWKFEDEERNSKSVDALMHQTYAEQRQAVNKSSCPMRVVEEFPFLIEQEFLMKHFQTLSGKDSDLILCNFLSKSDKVISYFEQNDSEISKLADIPNATMKALLLIITHFKEDSRFIFQQHEVPKHLKILYLKNNKTIFLELRGCHG